MSPLAVVKSLGKVTTVAIECQWDMAQCPEENCEGSEGTLGEGETGTEGERLVRRVGESAIRRSNRKCRDSTAR